MTTTATHFEKAMSFAQQEHDKVNQKYGEKPYSFHLQQVDDWVTTFLSRLPADVNPWLVSAGAWVHDLLEDVKTISYDTLREVTNEEIAQISTLLDKTGKTKDQYLKEMATNREAVMVKVADRIANTQYSLEQKSSMFNKYKQEYDHFQKFLRPAWPELEPMWHYLDRLYSYNPYPSIV